MKPSDSSHSGTSPSGHRPGPSSNLLPISFLTAAVVLTSVLVWRLAEGPQGAAPGVLTATAATTRSPLQTPPPPALAPRLSVPTGPAFTDVDPPQPSISITDEQPLTDRLDQFFLAGVSLDRVPLQQAIRILQGQLKDLNFLKAETLEKLRITVQPQAAGRLITFHSGSIAFLKAIRAVAAIGGCNVIVDDTTLALIVTREIYPQVTERRNLLDLLPSSLRSDGKRSASDLQRLANLLNDALSVGIELDSDRPLSAQSLTLATRGQWMALSMLTSARDQAAEFPSQNYELYLVEGTSANPSGQAISVEEATALRRQFQEQGIRPIATVSSNGTSTTPTITSQPLGDTVELTVNLPKDQNLSNANTDDQQPNNEPLQDPSLTSFQGTILPGQGLAVPVIKGNHRSASSNLMGGLTFLPSPTAVSRTNLFVQPSMGLTSSYGSAGIQSPQQNYGSGATIQLYRSGSYGGSISGGNALVKVGSMVVLPVTGVTMTLSTGHAP